MSNQQSSYVILEMSYGLEVESVVRGRQAHGRTEVE